MATEPYEAGAGRGKQGGPTAEQLLDYEEEGVWSPRKAARGDYGPKGKTVAPSDVMPKPKKYAKGGSVSASKRADGCAQRGKTKGRYL
jgi:hypothetical protein